VSCTILTIAAALATFLLALVSWAFAVFKPATIAASKNIFINAFIINVLIINYKVKFFSDNYNWKDFLIKKAALFKAAFGINEF
jgi:hypothetical protein